MKKKDFYRIALPFALCLKLDLNEKSKLLLISIFIMGFGFSNAQELYVSKTSYKLDEGVAISFSGGPANALDWVGIYKEGQTPGGVDRSIQATYVDGRSSGEFYFDPLPSGKYEAHLFENDSYEILTSVLFEVRRQSVVSVKLSKTSYKNDEKISVSFSGGQEDQKDWIAIYKKGEIPGEVSSLRWSYLEGKNSGELV